jgi:hypothetical protein
MVGRHHRHHHSSFSIQPHNSLLALLCHLEAVAEVNVDELARVAVQHEVGWVAVPKAKNVAHHVHHRQRPSVPDDAPSFQIE